MKTTLRFTPGQFALLLAQAAALPVKGTDAVEVTMYDDSSVAHTGARFELMVLSAPQTYRAVVIVQAGAMDLPDWDALHRKGERR